MVDVRPTPTGTTVVCMIHDPGVRARIARALEKCGCRVESVRPGVSPHAVLVDRTDDIAPARTLFGVPIVALGTPESGDKMEEAMLYGADDYVPSHVSPELLAARIVARSYPPPDVLTFEDLVLYHRERILRHGARCIRLTNLESRLLESFMLRPYVCHTIDELIETIWPGNGAKPGTVQTFICLLRRKLHAAGEADLIETVHGVGYRFGLVRFATDVKPITRGGPQKSARRAISEMSSG
jgi:DNA-binding winged helix-turn-helix (wHTH) protein